MKRPPGSRRGRPGVTHDARDAGGLDVALRELLRTPVGPALLGIVAGALIAYGLFLLLVARYREVQAPGETPGGR